MSILGLIIAAIGVFTTYLQLRKVRCRRLDEESQLVSGTTAQESQGEQSTSHMTTSALNPTARYAALDG